MKRDTETQRVRRAVIVHHGLDTQPSPDGARRSHVFQVVAVGEDDKNWTIDRGPAPADWTDDGAAFGQVEPGLPPVRFEGDLDGDVVHVIAPVLDDAWILRASFQRDGDDLVPVGLDLRPRPGAQINARVLRTLGFGGVQKAAVKVLLQHPEIARDFGDRWGRPVTFPGKAGRKDLHYAEAAHEYVQALAENPRRPIALLIERAAERGEHVTEGEVRSRLTAARDRKLLTAAPRGRAGGELTDKARALLGIDEEGNQ